MKTQTCARAPSASAVQEAPGTAIAGLDCACFTLLFTGKTGHSRVVPKGFGETNPIAKR